VRGGPNGPIQGREEAVVSGSTALGELGDDGVPRLLRSTNKQPRSPSHRNVWSVVVVARPA